MKTSSGSTFLSSFCEKTGRSLRHKIEFTGYTIGYLGKVVKSSFQFVSKGKPSRKILMMQLLFTCVEALPLISVMAVVLGSAIHILGYSTLASLGKPELLYSLLVLVVTRELGPILIAFIVTARSATAIATEIASMVVSHEIEAYISIGIDPINHIVAPRFLGVTISMLLLNIYFSFFGLIAPIAIIQFLETMSMEEYFSSLLQALTLETLGISILKSMIFGMIISIISTLYGFNVHRASTEVPQAGIQAVGKTFIYIVVADVFITALSYIL